MKKDSLNYTVKKISGHRSLKAGFCRQYVGHSTLLSLLLFFSQEISRNSSLKTKKNVTLKICPVASPRTVTRRSPDSILPPLFSFNWEASTDDTPATEATATATNRPPETRSATHRSDRGPHHDRERRTQCPSAEQFV